jgi:hypothetical protein
MILGRYGYDFASTYHGTLKRILRYCLFYSYLKEGTIKHHVAFFFTGLPGLPNSRSFAPLIDTIAI